MFVLGAMLGACKAEEGGIPFFDRGACDVLIECAATLAPEARDGYEAAYGPNGQCWASGPGAWAGCRDFCATTLETLNLVAMISGETCGQCSSDADCGSFGLGSTCQQGLCSGGSGGSGDNGSDASSDGTDTQSDSTTDTGGCSPVPSVCEDLVACLEIALPTADTTQFEAGGACWCGTSSMAADCTDTCVEQLAAAANAYPNIEACAGVIDPCAVAVEGCECSGDYDCSGNLLCGDLSYTCYAPEFGTCEPDGEFQDPFCPTGGCPNEVVYLDKDMDGVADFASCKITCSEEFGLG